MHAAVIPLAPSTARVPARRLLHGCLRNPGGSRAAHGPFQSRPAIAAAEEAADARDGEADGTPIGTTQSVPRAAGRILVNPAEGDNGGAEAAEKTQAAGDDAALPPGKDFKTLLKTCRGWLSTKLVAA